MTSDIRRQPAWQSHRNGESMDSEISYFDALSTCDSDSSSGYFQGWEAEDHDKYCPQIASISNSPTRSKSDETQICDSDEMLQAPYSHKVRPTSIRRNVEAKHASRSSKRTTKRFGIVPYADPQVGDAAVVRLNGLLYDPLSDTEKLLEAMYSPDWDATSLQRWYHQSSKSSADLALLKIMFSLRYTINDLPPIS